MLRETTKRLLSALVSGLLITALQATVARADRGNDDGDAELHGVVESLPASGLVGDWVVSGTTVHVTSSTDVKQEHGRAAVGAAVEVKGDRGSDGSIDARRVEVESAGGDDDSGDDDGGGSTGGEAKIFGVVESLPAGGFVGTWTVSGRAVRVSASTVVEREHGVTPGVGSRVEAEGAQLRDGSIDARKIEVRTGGGSPAPGTSNDASSGYVELRATIDAMPADGLVGEWTVGGRTVFVSVATQIKKASRAKDGVLAEVRGNQRADGSIDANRLEIKAKRRGASSSSFYGTVDALPVAGLVGEWSVGGRTVFVDGSTVVDEEHGRAAVGAYVEVHGATNATGQFVATRVEVKAGGGVGSSGYIEFRGTVERLPAFGLVGDWTVSGRTVHVSGSTAIRLKHGPVIVGGRVEIEGNQRSDGSVDATKVGTED